jgi:HK97 family phage prohead protease
MADQERRTISQPVEYRQADEGARLSGYAAIFDSPTEIAGMFREIVAPGAFAKAVADDDVRALFNHDANFVLGRTTSRTLRLTEDATGLRYDVDPPDTQWARDLMVSVQRGDVSQSSFAFEVLEDEWSYGTRGEMPTRTIRAVKLYDVSPVTYPAYESTTVSARSRELSAGIPDDLWRVAHSRDRCRWVDVTTR